MNYLEMKNIFSSYIYQDFLVFLVTKYITFFFLGGGGGGGGGDVLVICWSW